MERKSILPAEISQDHFDLIEAIEQAGVPSESRSEVVERFRNLRLGWSAEREFMAMCIWMGQCDLIHRLDQEGQFPADAKDNFRVPDLFAVLRAENSDPVAVLIEVKSTKNVKLIRGPGGTARSTREGRLVFGENYYHGLIKYAELAGHPMLIAWKIREAGLWFLFDIRAMERHEKAYHADIPHIAKHDLMGVLLGNVFLQVAKGSGWVLDIKKEKETSPTSFVGTITRSVLASPQGQEYHGKGPLLPILMQCDDDVDVVQNGDVVTQKFFVPDDSGVIGYRMLPQAVKGFSDDPVNWLTVLRDQKFHWSYAQLQQTAREGIDLGFINYVIHPYPSEVPVFLDGHLGHRRIR